MGERDAKIGRAVRVLWAHMWRFPVWLTIALGFGWFLDWFAGWLTGKGSLGGSAAMFISLTFVVMLLVEEKAEKALRGGQHG